MFDASSLPVLNRCVDKLTGELVQLQAKLNDLKKLKNLSREQFSQIVNTDLRIIIVEKLLARAERMQEQAAESPDF